MSNIKVTSADLHSVSGQLSSGSADECFFRPVIDPDCPSRPSKGRTGLQNHPDLTTGITPVAPAQGYAPHK